MITASPERTQLAIKKCARAIAASHLLFLLTFLLLSTSTVVIHCCYSMLFTVVIHCCYSILVQFATAANLTATAAANITAAVTLGRLACCAAIRDEENRHDRHRNLTFNLPVAYHIDSASHNGV